MHNVRSGLKINTSLIMNVLKQVIGQTQSLQCNNNREKNETICIFSLFIDSDRNHNEVQERKTKTENLQSNLKTKNIKLLCLGDFNQLSHGCHLDTSGSFHEVRDFPKHFDCTQGPY